MSRRHRVRLRAVRPDEVALLDRWRVDPQAKGEYNDLGPLAPSDLAAQVADGTVVGPERGTLVVEVAGAAVGTVGWMSQRYGPNEQSRCYNVGIALLPEARGHGYGTEAQRMLVDYLFATTPVHRVEATTDVGNLPEQKSLERAGFLREGVIRGAQYRAGAWHDLVGFARLRSDS